MSSHKRVMPLQPLLELTELLGPTDIASLCGVSRETVTRWRSGSTATITAHAADHMAVRMGMHPAEIWGEHWWNIPDILDPADRKRAYRLARSADE